MAKRVERGEWQAVAWLGESVGDVRKSPGGDGWNEAKRVERLFESDANAVAYLGTDTIGTGLWCDVRAEYADGSRRTVRITGF